MDWISISAAYGLLVPLIIELTAKKLKGKWKIVIVFMFCITGAIVGQGVLGAWENWDISQLIISSIIVLALATNSWSMMWKKWFKNDPDPLLKATVYNPYGKDGLTNP
ncbi:MAG: hypothetical protein KAH01_07705 [Caldisericia bacterium]|nr:hypothetical protein [Caldisericia bacterium]